MFRQLAFAATLLGAFVGALPVPCSGAQLSDVEHIIVIYLENHSFDNLFGLFPNADGIAAAGATKIQVDPDGHPYTFLPPVQHLVKKPDGTKGAEVEDRFPDNLPNQPFSIDAFVPIGEATGDLLHRYYDQIEQIDGGRMDKFAAYSDARGLAMGFYDESKTKLWDYAKRYTLADHFFHAAFGGSFLNHFWMICACTPRYEGVPPDGITAKFVNGHISQLGLTGMIRTDLLSPQGYAVNTMFAQLGPHPEHPTPPFDNFLPPHRCQQGADDRQPPERQEHNLGMVFGRLGRRRRRQGFKEFSIPPSALRLFQPLRTAEERAPSLGRPGLHLGHHARNAAAGCLL